MRDPIQRSPSWSACANSDQNKPKINARFATRSRWVQSSVYRACTLTDYTLLRGQAVRAKIEQLEEHLLSLKKQLAKEKLGQSTLQ